jgi:tRNA threonylcarbamoyladenosine biosynthesis protein TsaB
MLILAFDTTVAACSVALWRDGETLAHARSIMDQGQAEALMPMIEGVMRQSGLAYSAVDRIAVTVGPGSFTGVRVGLAAARGLGLAAGKPVIGVMTTEALAHAVPAHERKQDARILCAVDTKRGDIYAQIFDAHLVEMGAPHVLKPTQLTDAVGAGPVVVVGDAAAIAVSALGPHATLSSAAALPDPAVIAQCAASRRPTAAGPLPVYVRPPDAVVPQHGGRLRI